MKDCKHIYTELDGTCLGCGLTEEWRTIESLKEEVSDLKARLRSIRKHAFSPAVMDSRTRIQFEADLRVKNWRTP